VRTRDDIDLTNVYGLLSWLWRHKAPILVGGLVCMALALAYVLLATPRYKATVSMLPQSDQPAIGILNQIELVSSLSFNGSQGNEELYGKIVTSQPILDALIARRWNHSEHEDGQSLYAIFDVDPDGEGCEEELNRILCDEVISFSRDRRTGYMEVSAAAPNDPLFAADLANAVVEELDHFNKHTRKYRAQEQRVFLEEREEIALRELNAAEDTLAAFVRSNRSYSDSPVLQVEYNRLSRTLGANSKVWVELRRQLEMSRVEENKDLMSVSILAPASPPVRPASPRPLRDLVLGFVLGCAIALLLLALREQKIRSVP